MRGKLEEVVPQIAKEAKVREAWGFGIEGSAGAPASGIAWSAATRRRFRINRLGCCRGWRNEPSDDERATDCIWLRRAIIRPTAHRATVGSGRGQPRSSSALL
jgi:hypothetical protein